VTRVSGDRWGRCGLRQLSPRPPALAPTASSGCLGTPNEFAQDVGGWLTAWARMACRLADGRRPADFGTGELSSQPTHPESQLIDFF
jgi:hypothetical protein